MPKLVAASALVILMLAVPAVAMEVGSERLFEGMVKVTVASDIGLGSTMSGRSGQVQLRELVLEHDGKGYHCLHFRRYPWGENEWIGDIVRFVVVAKDRRATDVSLLTDDSLPFLPRHLWLPTPPLRRTGQVWENKADTTVWWFAPKPLPTRYRLIGSERVNGQPCWVVERTLPPQIGAVQLKRYREWWLAKADGATVRYALEMAMNQTLPLGGVYSLELQLELQLRQKNPTSKRGAGEIAGGTAAVGKLAAAMDAGAPNSIRKRGSVEGVRRVAERMGSVAQGRDGRMARPMRLDALGFSIGGDAAAVNGGEVAKGSSNSCPRFRLEGHRRCHT